MTPSLFPSTQMWLGAHAVPALPRLEQEDEGRRGAGGVQALQAAKGVVSEAAG